MRPWLNNNRVMLDPHKANLVSACETCSCECPEESERGIRYVDKHASGTGDGLSWANAYTGLQDAIDVFSRHKIYIKGYGDTDPYDSISLMECTWLEGGVNGDVYIGSGNGYSIDGHLYEGTYLNDITTVNGSVGFYGCCGMIITCNARNNHHGFNLCSPLNGFTDCHAGHNSGTGFTNCTGNFTECTANYNSSGFSTCNGDFNTCEASYNDYSGFNGITGDIANCNANNNTTDGFNNVSGTMEECTANNNVSGAIGCNVINNCTFNDNSTRGASANYISNCTQVERNADGLEADTIINCEVHNNTGVGLLGNNIINCISTYNTQGVSQYGTGGAVNCTFDYNYRGGSAALATDCTFNNNTSSGIIRYGTFVNCTASNNGEHGLSELYYSSTSATDCSFNNNGVHGLFSRGSCSGCTANGNGQSGFRYAACNSCSATGNKLHGFQLCYSCTNCTASANAVCGFGATITISGCTAVGNCTRGATGYCDCSALPRCDECNF